ncbi:MAG: glutamate-1-semialdehyde 2,1-aminomutase [Spirochaetia bacterium]|nr:glutamate-1-semialdehyde 2,1-aminomutase [Spirochaetia bacterium]
MDHNNSNKIWQESVKYLAGGVNSPVRAYGSVGGNPVVMKKGEGAFLIDEDNNKYLDFVNSWGPLILGHCNKELVDVLKNQVEKGTSFGTITKAENELARLICENIHHVEMIRFVNSGTEAVMSALRLARGYTSKSKIIKFEGCYHGHHDSMLVKAGSGLLTFSGDISLSSSPGVPESFAEDTIVLPLDEEEILEKTFESLGDKIAAVILEAVPANSGLLPQRLEFVKKIQILCEKYSALFIADEVITGFRLGFSGFCGKYNIKPDLVTYGKIIGGGLPVGAFGGKKEIMNHLSPVGKVYQAGTLSGNPLAMAAGYTSLKILKEQNVYEHLNNLATYLKSSFDKLIMPALNAKSFTIKLVQEESIFWLNIREKDSDELIRRVDKIWQDAAGIYKQIFWHMLENGIHIAPSAYEVGFLSHPMTKEDIDFFINNLKTAIDKID